MNIGIIHTQSTYISALEHALQTPLLVRGKQLDVRLSCPDDFSDVKMTSKRLPNSASVLDKDPMPHSGERSFVVVVFPCKQIINILLMLKFKQLLIMVWFGLIHYSAFLAAKAM